MHISLRALHKATEANIMRLAKYLQIITYQRKLEDIIEEIWEKINE